MLAPPNTAVRSRKTLAPLLAMLAVLGYLALVPVASGARAATGTHVAFGAHTSALDESEVRTLESRIGRRIGIVHTYVQWGTPVDGAWARAATAADRTLLMTWEPWQPPEDYVPVPGQTGEQAAFRLDAIVAGRFDGYIRSVARDLAALGTIVYLRPMHEMNGNWYPWAGAANGNDAATYVRAWRRLHRIFAEERATNVRWVFAVNAEDVPASNRFEAYYPGRRHVDVLAVDGYNWGASLPLYGGWRRFDQIFARPIERLARLGPQRIWITEVASSSEGGDKARWVRDMFETLAAPAYARVSAVVWFDLLKERDWRMTSSPAVARAFSV